MEWRKGAWLPQATLSSGSGMPFPLLQAGDDESTTTEGKTADGTNGKRASDPSVEIDNYGKLPWLEAERRCNI
uniref:Uncharacterized protein n=1 Tax=Oryza rufipogon TaxID=4529 RepID=A0A0E0NX31_ORYRU